MSWLDWLRKQMTSTGSEQEPSPAADRTREDTPSDLPTPSSQDVPPELAGLDFYSAIAVHQRWKNRLKDHVLGRSDENLDPAVVGRCDVCDLGRWLATQDGQAPIPSDLLDQLQREHAEFHRLAAEVIRLAQQGQRQQALEALRTDAPYNRTSHRVTKLLGRIYLDLSEFHQPSSPFDKP